MPELPSGTVTLLFTDIEGSTRLVQQLGDEYGSVLESHRRLLRDAVRDAGGHEVDCRADELFAVFQRSTDALAATVEAQRKLGTHTWPDSVSVRVRMSVHTGEPAVEGGAYLGLDVSRAARICAAGHGGQILLSQTTADLVGDVELKDLGSYPLAGLPRPERIYQVLAAGLRTDFPPLRVGRVERSHLQQVLRRIRPSRQPTLAEEAWRVRAMLPRVSASLQRPLGELGAELFTSDRAVAGADRFLTQIDRRRLARRLAAQREMAVASQHARKEAESLERKIACVDQLHDRRQALTDLAIEVCGKLDALRAEQEVAALRERVAAATTELDDAVSRAASILDPLSFKLVRTRNRGVYRSGRHYVVPFTDDLGAERRREFETLADATDFRAALRLAEKAQSKYTGPSIKGWRS
jgi:class 3 adenylate cyclase